MHVGDFDAVAAAEAHAYEFPWPREAFLDCLDVNHKCLLAQRGERTVGHGVLSAAGEARLFNVCIEPGDQGRGHGRALTGHLIERAKARGAEAVFLEVRLSNRIAMTLYHGLGFREIGRRRNHYRAQRGREDAVVMALAHRFTGPRRTGLRLAVGRWMRHGGRSTRAVGECDQGLSQGLSKDFVGDCADLETGRSAPNLAQNCSRGVKDVIPEATEGAAWLLDGR